MADKDLEQQKKESIAAVKQTSSEVVKDIKSTTKDSLSSIKEQSKENLKELKSTARESISDIKAQTKTDIKKIKQLSKEAQAEFDGAVKSFQVDVDLEKKLLVDDINDARTDISSEAEEASKSIKGVIDNVKEELNKTSQEFGDTVEQSTKQIEDLAEKIDGDLNKKIKDFDKKIDKEEKKNEKEGGKKKRDALSVDVLQAILNEVVIIRKLAQGKTKQKTSGGQQQNSFLDRMKSMFAKKKKPQVRDAQGRFTKVAEEVKPGESADWLARAGEIASRIGKVLDIVKAAAIPMMSALLPALAIAGAIGAAIQIAKDFREKQDKRNTLKELESIPLEQRTPEQQKQIEQLHKENVYRTPGEAMRAARQEQFARMDRNPAYSAESTPTPAATTPQPNAAPTPVSTASATSAAPVSMEEKKAVDFMKRQAGVAVTPEGKFIDVWQRNAPLTEQEARTRITDAGGDFNALMKVVKKTPQPVERPAPTPAAATPPPQAAASSSTSAQATSTSATPVSNTPTESNNAASGTVTTSPTPTLTPPAPSTGENIAQASMAVEQAQEEQPQVSIDAVSTESSAEVKRPLLPEAVPQIYGDRDGFAKFEIFNYTPTLSLNNQ